MVLPRAANVHDVITGGQDTIAIRVPAHPMAQQLLTAFGGGIAAPSANRYGRLSPTRAEHVREELGEAVRVLLDGGECQIGLESTIVCLRGRERAPAASGRRHRGADPRRGRRAVQRPRRRRAARAGQRPAHYAPTTPMTIVPAGEIDAQADAASVGGAPRRGAGAAPAAARPQVRHLDQRRAAPGELRPRPVRQPAHARQGRLRRTSWCRPCPTGERWDAIRDRLVRAATAVAEADDGTGTRAVLP